MRKGQGLPVNMIVLTALALLVLVVVGAFFISGFGQASSSVTIVSADQSQCQGICQELASMAFNYDKCINYSSAGATDLAKFAGGLGATAKAREYACRCENFGSCTITLRGGVSCSLSQGAYNAVGYTPAWTTKGTGYLCTDWLQ